MSNKAFHQNVYSAHAVRPSMILQKSDRITDRCVVYTGLKCDLRCKICYYDHKKQNKAPTEEVISRLHIARYRFGCRKADITGGEPTIHPGICEILGKAREFGIAPRIITHGQHIPKVAEKLKSAGLAAFLISCHGTKEIHDKIQCWGNQRRKDSRYENVIAAFDTCKRLRIPFSTNTVVNQFNWKHLHKMAPMFLHHKPRSINLICFNAFYEWSGMDNIPHQGHYSDYAKGIKKLIDAIDGRIPITVRYMPFCLMPGYEKHIMNFPQLPYDPNEWDYAAWANDTKGDTDASMCQWFLRGCEVANDMALANTGRSDELYYNAVATLRHAAESGYRGRAGKCAKCPLRLVCDGITRQYERNFGEKELKPWRGGAVVFDPLYFKEDTKNVVRK